MFLAINGRVFHVSRCYAFADICGMTCDGCTPPPATPSPYLPSQGAAIEQGLTFGASKKAAAWAVTKAHGNMRYDEQVPAIETFLGTKDTECACLVGEASERRDGGREEALN